MGPCAVVLRPAPCAGRVRGEPAGCFSQAGSGRSRSPQSAPWGRTRARSEGHAGSQQACAGTGSGRVAVEVMRNAGGHQISDRPRCSHLHAGQAPRCVPPYPGWPGSSFRFAPEPGSGSRRDSPDPGLRDRRAETDITRRRRIAAQLRCFKAFNARTATTNPNCQCAETHICSALMNRISALGSADFVRVSWRQWGRGESRLRRGNCTKVHRIAASCARILGATSIAPPQRRCDFETMQRAACGRIRYEFPDALARNPGSQCDGGKGNRYCHAVRGLGLWRAACRTGRVLPLVSFPVVARIVQFPIKLLNSIVKPCNPLLYWGMSV